MYSYIIDIGNVSSDDIANGKLENWNSLRDIELGIKVYGSTTDSADVNATLHDGSNYSSAGYFRPPTIEIQAIGEENLVYNLTNQYSITEGQTLETLAGYVTGGA